MKVEQSSQAAINGVGDTGPTDVPTTDSPPLMPLAQLQFSGDPGAMMAALTIESAKSQSDVARAQRDAAMSAEEKADAAEIQDMHDKANLQRIQGAVDGALQIAQGAADLGAGLNEANGSKQSKTDAAWCKAGASVAAAGKSISDGLFNGAITDKDASAKVHDTSAQFFKQVADDAHDTERDAKALLDKAIEFYKEYSDTKSQTMMAAIHRA